MGSSSSAMQACTGAAGDEEVELDDAKEEANRRAHLARKVVAAPRVAPGRERAEAQREAGAEADCPRDGACGPPCIARGRIRGIARGVRRDALDGASSCE